MNMKLRKYKTNILYGGKDMNDVIEKILEFIEDNRPTEVNTDWERGCAYALDEIEKLINENK